MSSAVAQTAEARPALAFMDAEPQMPRVARILTEQSKHHNEDRGVGNNYFARMAVAGDDDLVDRVVYSVEDVDGDPGQWCRVLVDTPSGCRDVKIGIRQNSGLMYLYLDPAKHSWLHPTGDFPARQVELSVDDPESDLKVYRSFLVDRSDSVPDCGDYPERNRDRFACLFLGEKLPDEADLPETTEAIRQALPNLTQPKSQYSLIFEELFDDGAAADSIPCENGLLSLDASIWQLDRYYCDAVDPAGLPCLNVVAGHMSYGWYRGCSKPSLDTAGRFDYKYGYLEVKYTIELMPNNGYRNYSFFLYGNWEGELDSYNIDVNNARDYLSNTGPEIDIYEAVSNSSIDIFHQYMDPNGQYMQARTLRTVKYIGFCKSVSGIKAEIKEVCDRSVGDREFTVTKGVEWTPRGYLTYVKVDGLHDNFIPYPSNQVRVQYRAVEYSSEAPENRYVDKDFITEISPWRTTDESGFSEAFSAPGGSVTLEQVGIGHVPAWLRLSTLGWSGPTTEITSRMHVDYIRVFQPENLYADMEPVYK